MPDVIDADGLQIKTLSEITDEIVVSFQATYGAEINVDPNSPDGQMINIFAQASEDVRNVLVSVYNSFTVPNAQGVTLDDRVALNGLQRQLGTRTTLPITVTVTQALTLAGLDGAAPDSTNPVFYTIQNAAGDTFQLVTSKAFSGAGTASLLFICTAIGQTIVSPNTITTQTTVVTGVSSVNNPTVSVITTGNTTNTSPTVTNIPTTAALYAGLAVSGTGIAPNTLIASVDSATQVTLSLNATATGTGVALTFTTRATVLGENEETDAQLRLRHARSFYLQAINPADSIEAALGNAAGVTDALVVENYTGGTVGGVPAHSIWCIVEGGADAVIAQAIYAKKAPGCGMKGSETYAVTRPNGTTFTAAWDVALYQDLFIEFGIIWVGTPTLSNDDIADALADALTYELGQDPCVGDVFRAMQIIAPTAILTDAGVSDDGATFASIVVPTTAQYKYTLSAGNITIT